MIREAAAQAIHGAICEESLEDHLDPDWPGRCVRAAEAIAPVLAEAWDKGHESGFWNGRESHGDVTGCLVGVEHAEAHNPYGPPNE